MSRDARPELEAQGNLCVVSRAGAIPSLVMRAMRFNWRYPYKDSTGSIRRLRSEQLPITFGIMISNEDALHKKFIDRNFINNNAIE